MKGQTDKESPDRVEGKQPVTASRPGIASARHDGKHGVVQSDATIEQVLSPANLQRAWKRVKANRGAPGIDAMSIDDFPAFKAKHWERIDSDLRKETYRPAPVRLYYWEMWFRRRRPTRPGAQRTGTTTTDATAPPDRHGNIPRGGQNGVTQSERLLANERQCSGATRLEQRLAARSRGS